MAEPTSSTRDFSGAFGPTPTFTSVEVFRAEQDVAIPVADARLSWSYAVRPNLSLGVTGSTAIWVDVPVPPGVEPSAGNQALHENTIVFFGVQGTVAFRF